MNRTTTILMAVMATITVGQAPAKPSFSLAQQTIMAVQRELTHLGYYHGPIDGVAGPQTQKAVRWFQSIDKLPVTGQIDGPTLEALRIIQKEKVWCE
jgi:peptidoglycan hydrolase-like protein with peptidoglycan-binding domain